MNNHSFYDLHNFTEENPFSSVFLSEFIGPDRKGQPDLKTITADFYAEDAFVRKLEKIAEERDIKFAPFVRKALVYSMFKEGFLHNL